MRLPGSSLQKGADTFHPRKTQRTDPWGDLVRLLRARPRSLAEVRLRLRERGHEMEEVDSVIARAVAAGLLDDGAFAKLWVRDRTGRHPLSRTAVTQELRDKGIGEDLILQTLRAEYPPEDEIGLARDLAVSRLSRLQGLSPEKQKAHILAFLRRRGFGFDVALQAIHGAQEEAGDERQL